MNLLGLGGGGGYAAQGSDPNLTSKLAALKRKGGSPDNKVDAFLRRDVGVDPEALPFTFRQAVEYAHDMIEADFGDWMVFHATSMELQRVVVEVDDGSPPVHKPDSADWADLLRTYAALRKQFPEHYSFKITHDFDNPVEPLALPSPRQTDPTKYPSGSVLRIQRKVPTGDTLVLEHQYIRIGGLFDDTTPTILETMTPMPDLTGWTVIEELT